MDDLTLLRTLRDDVASPEADALTRARVLLTTRIHEEEALMARTPATSTTATRRLRPKGSGLGRRRLGGRRLGGLAFGAAAVAAAIVVGATVLPGTGGAAQASDVLDAAAAATIRQADPVVAPGQYLKIETTGISAATLGLEGDRYLQWLDETTSTLYVPKDANDLWVLKNGLAKPVTFFSGAAKKWALADFEKKSASGSGSETLRGRGGDFGGDTPAVQSPSETAAIAELPRDPEALLAHFRAEAGTTDVHGDAETFTLMADLLRSGQAPADLRAGLYRALAMIPGVTVSDEKATLDGRSGVALGLDDGDVRREIVVDRDSGLLIGERAVLTKARGDMPTGTVVGSTSVKTSVVSSAP
ncbi:CU044_5270 family protein [Frondihabitans cladoniiphilus]|uniref:Uncharacterized protein n=1 Tax=Frondihabitans cladoniiphilus TaxID=715785 RepID=A0ABP8VZ11_9MICO